MARGGRHPTSSTSALELKGLGGISPISVHDIEIPSSSVPKQIQIPAGSYAALVDPDEGSMLRFIPVAEVNGIKCPQIESADVISETEYWQSVALCSVLGANPPLETSSERGTSIIASYSSGNPRGCRGVHTRAEQSQTFKIIPVLRYVGNPSFPLITRPAQHISSDPYKRLLSYLACTQSALLKLNRDRFADLRQQQAMARMALESIQLKAMAEPKFQARQHYSQIVSSMIALIRQQCKVDWLNYGDDCMRYFFAKAKQRKVDSYVYSIQDNHGNDQQGFGEVVGILQDYFKALLGPSTVTRPPINP
ncbi:hypothetical protein Cgig2_009611 [Carnegiea gigantea]|uniref:Uncharacterized protein n=1 Tax=Carnegiea gigantea TaxID=171969 RepID=A0A9Q1Q7A5_9CARY|nr:hypothetical protein Cgig2_009611 [Carnegiea gigantea]